jgi:hypothetical protein
VGSFSFAWVLLFFHILILYDLLFKECRGKNTVWLYFFVEEIMKIKTMNFSRHAKKLIVIKMEGKDEKYKTQQLWQN